MNAVLQLLSGFGPAVLVIIGLALYLALGAGLRRGHWIGLIAFLVVGIPVSIAAFLETRPSAVSNGAATEGVTRPETSRAASGGERRTRSEHSVPSRVAFVTAPQTYRNTNRHGLLIRHNRPRPRTVIRVIRVHAPVPAHPPSVVITHNNTAIPPNTLVCTGFSRDPDGEWEAGDDTLPFAVGDETNFTIRGQGPIGPDWMEVGGVDLYALLNAKCAAGAKSRR